MRKPSRAPHVNPKERALADLVARADRASRANRDDEARRLYAEVVRLNPRHAEALHNLGLLAHKSRDHALAAAQLRRAIAARPETALYRTHLGVVLRASGSPGEAAEAHREAIRLDPALYIAHNNLGNALRDLGQAAEAVESFREAVRLKPDYADGHLNLGLALGQLGKPDEAEAAMRVAIAQAPGLAKAHFELGNLLRNAQRFDEAEAEFRAAIAANPGDAASHINLASTVQSLGRVEEAPALFRRALELGPHLPESHIGVGGALQQEGRFEEATAAYREAIRLDPNSARGYAALAGGAPASVTEADLAEMERLAAAPRINAEDRCDLMFALAAMHERAGRYDKAFEHARQANAHVKRTLRFDAQENAAFVARSEATFTRDFFEAREWRGSDSSLPIFVVGLPRSGTTLVEQILAAHPKVFAAGEVVELPTIAKELPRLVGGDLPYPDCVAKLTPASAAPIAERYLGHLRARGAGAERITDKLPFNFRSLGLIALLFPNARIVHCRRDARDVAVSCYLLNFLKPISFAYDLVDFGQYHRAYERLMAHWRKVLPVPIHEVRYEEMIADQERATRALLEFCGLEWSQRCLEFDRVDRPVRTASSQQVRQPIYSSSVGRWRRFEKHLGPLVQALGLAPAPEAAEPAAAPPAGAGGRRRRPVKTSADSTDGGGALAVRPPVREDPRWPAITQHFKAARWPQAEATLRDILSANPEDASAWHGLGYIAYRTANHAVARTHFEKAVELDPGNASYLSSLGASCRGAGDLDAAVKHYRKALSIAPDDVATLGNMGNALRQQGKLDEALACYGRAVALNPKSVSARTTHSSALTEAKLYERAVRRSREALRLDPSSAEGHKTLGNALLGKADYAGAIDCYRRAVELAPDDHAVHHNLATALQYLGRMDDAADHYRRAVAAKPDSAASRRQLAGIKQFRASDDELKELEALLRQPDIKDDQRSDIYFGLAKVYDDLGEYASAFTRLQAGNQIVRMKLKYDADRNTRYVDRLISAFTADFFAARRDHGSDSRVPIFIVGMPRSGTTLTEQIIASHPMVYGAGELTRIHELVVDYSKRQFNNKIDIPDAIARLDRADSLALAQKFLRHLRGIDAKAPHLTDKMPFNFRLLAAIALMFPQAKIIHTRRHALDICLSCYFARFRDALDFSFNLVELGRYYRDYERLMAHWRTALPGRMLEIQYEDLVADQEGKSREIIEFCGLEWDDRCLEFHKTERPVLTASSWQVRQPIYSTSVERWRNYEPFLTIAAAAIQASGKRSGFAATMPAPQNPQ